MLCVICSIFLYSCDSPGSNNPPQHIHSWVDATCTAPKTCSTCNTTTGNVIPHNYNVGICTMCGILEGDPIYHEHQDDKNDDKCDTGNESVLVIIDFYVLNDLHGKFCDTDTQPGVDNLASYLKDRENYDDNVILFSSGDMWQGAAESNLTEGLIITEWMNELNFVSMTLGNHEYDWGEDLIRKNKEAAEFPFLAINIYDNIKKFPPISFQIHSDSHLQITTDFTFITGVCLLLELHK